MMSGDRRRVRVEHVESVDVVFHGYTDEPRTLVDASYVPDLGFSSYSLHAVRRTHLVISDALGAHVIGTSVTFPRNSSGSYLRAARLPARTRGAKRKGGNDIYETLFRLFLKPTVTCI